MRILTRSLLAAAVLAFAPACQEAKNSDQDTDETAATGDEVDTETATATKTEAAKVPPKPADIPAPEDVAKPPEGAEKTENGVFYKVLTEGPEGGEQPGPDDTVEVDYTGWTTDGKMFDSSIKRGRRATFSLAQVIPGWTEGIQVMSEGDKTRFWIPEELAYKGKQGAPQGMLVFDVELFKVLKAPEVPADVAKPPRDAKKTPKGAFYKILEQGDGDKKPRSFDKVKVSYTGWTTDGKMFDSSVTKGRPAEFPLNAVIAGWSDGIQQMVVGDRARLWIPEKLAYEGQPGRPQGMLVFDVELLEITEMPAPPEVPKDVAKPPRGAKKTDKGVFYKVLEQGTGDKKPAATDKVEVHYTGWTTDGKMFDSSVTRGRTATFPLNAVIPGWTDGLQQMVEGDKMRFWIPEELAYKGKPGRPQGMLVFDVELVNIVE